MTLKSILVLIVGLTFSPEPAAATEICPPPWQCSQSAIEVRTWSMIFGRTSTLMPSIRSGYVPENPAVPFRGNVIYYQGFGDSMLNHLPLFELIANAGFRVIAFDYMGQGKSTGWMNDTRILEIPELGEKVWRLHARELPAYPKKTIIGWSTGGLAAYVEAALLPGTVARLVLIAPGIAPNKIVGEQNLLRGAINRITLPTLTTSQYDHGEPNPHVDPIRPQSPLDAPWFAIDLLKTAHKIKRVPVSRPTSGLVLLSGPNDTYVDADETKRVIGIRAPHFAIVQFPRALHEIDNEAQPDGEAAKQAILEFILRN